MLAYVARIQILLQVSRVRSWAMLSRGALCSVVRPAEGAQGMGTIPAPSTLQVAARTAPQGGECAGKLGWAVLDQMPSPPPSSPTSLWLGSVAEPGSQQSGGALMSRCHTVALPHRPLAEARDQGGPREQGACAATGALFCPSLGTSPRTRHQGPKATRGSFRSLPSHVIYTRFLDMLDCTPGAEPLRSRLS